MMYFGRLGRKIQYDFDHATRFHAVEQYPARMITPDTSIPHTPRYRTQTVPLKNGDRLTVFNSISAGTPFCTGDLQFTKYDSLRAAPMGIPRAQWKAMFAAALPAKLTKAGTGEVIDGTLQMGLDRLDDGFYLHDFKGKGYDSTHSLDSGDRLEVFSGVTQGNILWQGDVKTLRGAMPTMQKIRLLNEKGLIDFTRTGPEFVGNGLIQPNIKDVRKWAHSLPVMLERDID